MVITEFLWRKRAETQSTALERVNLILGGWNYVLPEDILCGSRSVVCSLRMGKIAPQKNTEFINSTDTLYYAPFLLLLRGTRDVAH